MKLLNGYRIKLVLVGIVATIVIGGNARADFTFGEPINLGPNINSSSCDDGLTISSDGLSIIFCSDRPSEGSWNLYMAARDTTEDEWGPAVNLGSPVNRGGSQAYPSISTDGLELFYTAPSWQSGWTEFGGADLWVSKRPSISGDWSAPENLGSVVNTSSHDTEPSISANGLELYFCSNRPGGSDEWTIWVTTRKTKDDPWEEPVDLGLGDAGTPNISANGFVLFFSSSRSGGYGGSDIWMTRRQTKDDPWEEPVNLGPPVSDWGRQWAPSISHDGSTLYFTDPSRRPCSGYFDIWQVSIEPVVDFNGDWIVDAADVCIMVDNWGTDEPLCDIGPTPFGDGIVDVQDLIVLAEHLFEEVPPTPSGSFTEDPAGTYTMTNRGAGIYGSADHFHFAYKTLAGPGSIVARIDNLTNTHAWAEAGVMIRETLDAGSKHTCVCVTPANVVAFHRRINTDSYTHHTNQTEITTPHWVRLERDNEGNFTAAHSHDGATWQSVSDAVPVNISMNLDVHIGLALTSRNTAETCEAVFTNVTITGEVDTEWVNQDVNPFD
jgi:Tol biopolymer transport system component